MEAAFEHVPVGKGKVGVWMPLPVRSPLIIIENWRSTIFVLAGGDPHDHPRTSLYRAAGMMDPLLNAVLYQYVY